MHKFSNLPFPNSRKLFQQDAEGLGYWWFCPYFWLINLVVLWNLLNCKATFELVNYCHLFHRDKSQMNKDVSSKESWYLFHLMTVFFLKKLWILIMWKRCALEPKKNIYYSCLSFVIWPQRHVYHFHDFFVLLSLKQLFFLANDYMYYLVKAKSSSFQ